MNVKACKTRRTHTYLALGAAFTIMCSLAAPAISAQLYKWQDENGVVHFTDKPPKGKTATKMRVKAPPTMGGDADEPAKDESQPNPRAERCEMERKRLQVLQSNMTVRMRNDDGTMRELSKEDMQEEIGLSQAAIERYCKPPATAKE